MAVFVTVSNVNSLITWLVCNGSTGPLWTACTVTVKLFVARQLRIDQSYGLLLVTTVVNGYTPGTCATDGVHRITPFVSIVDPAGPVSP